MSEPALAAFCSAQFTLRWLGSTFLDAEGWFLVAVLVVGILSAALAAAAEMALASVSRLQLRQALQAARGPARRAHAVDALLAEPARFLSTLLVLKLASFVAVTAAATLLARTWGGAWAPWGPVAALLVLILAQLLPRAWVLGRQDAVALALAPVVRILAFLFSPVTALMRRIGSGAVPKGMMPESIFLSEDGLRFLLNVADEEATIEDDEKEMIASIFEFGETLVREVMVPRVDVAAVPAEMPMPDALDIILKAGHSRIPVFKGSIDNVIGILYAKDLLRYLRDGRTDVPLGKILRPAYFIPESKKVDELLQELQQRKVHMAVVVDEYGGTAGVVTIEDLLEEIVGDIQDEYDSEEPLVEELGEGDYLFDARVALDEVNKLLEVELPTEGGDTLGGFIYSQLGKVPAVGDTIEFGDAKVEVLSVAGRSIKQVRATVRALATGEAPAAAGGGRRTKDEGGGAAVAAPAAAAGVPAVAGGDGLRGGGGGRKDEGGDTSGRTRDP